MESILTPKDREDFYIRLYFNTKDFERAGLKRAYLDFNRTLKIPENTSAEQRDEKKKKTKDFLRNELLILIKSDISSQEDFDEKHRDICARLIEQWDELTYGQAQKWINMTLKYWLLFGNERISEIEKNAKYFHLPVDSIVQKAFFSKSLPAWSKISSYEDYFWYQKIFREQNPNKIPIVEEFRAFNSN